MGKALSEMSLEELWQLFPIILKEHNPEYMEWYRIEKDQLQETLKDMNVVRINHIGSSVVPELIAKPTVDILLEVDKNCEIEELQRKIQNAGWSLMSSRYGNDLNLSFNKGYTENGFAEKVYHLHVRYFGDWGELYFRDYLLNHKEVAKEYGKLKMSLFKQYEHDRDGYTEAKTQFVKQYTDYARVEFQNKYLPVTLRGM